MTEFRNLVSAVLVCCLLTLAPVGAAPAHFISIDYPGATSTFIFGINTKGDVVGSFTDGNGVEHGFASSGGQFTSFDWPGATWTEGWGINPNGVIVGQYGWSANGMNTVHGFMLKDGVMSSLDVPEQPNTMPVKIGPEGTVVGCYHVGTPSGATILNTMYGFVMTAEGSITPQESSRTMNNGVDPEGDVVGFYYSTITNRPEQSYRISNGDVTWYQFPGAVSTQTWDIAPNGTIVGLVRSSLSGPNQFHGLLIENGAMSTFDVPGATATRAYGINASGDIVGYYTDANGAHGFLLTKKDTNGKQP
jgi:hypothetical protein